MASDLYAVHPAFTYWRTGRFGAHGVTNTTWEEKLESDPMLKDLVMTVELVFGSDSVVYVSSKPCTTTSGLTGRIYHWDPLLVEQPAIELTYSVGQTTSSARTFTVQLPTKMVDPTVLIHKNRMLAGIGEVSLTFDGADYDDRIVVIRGEMDAGVSFGPQEGGILETTITDPRETADITLPPYVVTTEGSPDALEDAIGMRFPIVFPQWDYVPCVFIDKGTLGGDGLYREPTLLVSAGTVVVDKVYVNGDSHGSGSSVYPWEVVQRVDKTGQPYTGVLFNATTAAGFDHSEGIYVSASVPGFLDRTKTIGKDTGAIEKDPVSQVKRLARDYTVLQSKGVNDELFGKSQAKLQHVRSRVCVNAGGSSNTTTMSYIEGAFLTSFPMISMVWEGGSYGPVVTDRMQSDNEVAYLVVGQSPLLSRASMVQETPKTSIFNEFQIRYGYNAMEDVLCGSQP